MGAAALMSAAPAGSPRLLADMRALCETDPGDREPAFERLEAAIGRELADRLVAALSNEPFEPGRQ